MLYDSYKPEHYQNLLFSGAGYLGPNGENLISMRQYYESESGESYSVAGQAAGWYRASKDASFYGGNSPTTDNDLNAQELVREALNQLAQDPSINLADYDIEDLIPREDMVVTVTSGGYIKRTPLVDFRSQRRGGKGVSGMQTKEEDVVTTLLSLIHI